MSKKLKWFSYLGLLVLSITLTHKITIKQKFQIDIWLKFVGKLVVLLICIAFIPANVLTLIYYPIYNFNQLLGELYNVLVCIYLYISGVLITEKISKWAQLQF